MNNFLGFPLNPCDALNNIEIMLEVGLLLSSTTNEEISEMGVAIIDLAKRYSAEVYVGLTKKVNEVAQIDKPEISHQKTFGERLKFALKEQGMTQGVLADWTGISQSTISSMATGKIKNIDTPRAEAIAKALDVSFVWLMHGEGGIYGTQPESLKLQAARLKFSGHNIKV